MSEVGRLSSTRRGTTHVEEGTTDPPLRVVFIELKQDGPSAEPELTTGAPAAFPRPRAHELLDDDRVTVWDYTWERGLRTPPVLYGRNTVWIWLAPGTLVTRDQKDAATRIAVKPGDLRRVLRGRVESDEAVQGTPRALIVAFK
jgi:hypothetical protein